MTTIFYKIISILLNIRVALASDTGTTNSGTTLPNPFGSSDINTVLSNILNDLLLLAIPIVTVMILWGAFQMMTAAGDPAQLETGKKTIKWAIIGFIIVLLASGIPYIIKEILGLTN